MSLTLSLSYCLLHPSVFVNSPALFRPFLKRARRLHQSILLLFTSTTYLNNTPPNPEIQPNKRCRLTTSPTKRGLISYVGAIPSLPGPPEAPWIGITLDEPVGKNDGSVPSGGRYFTCGRNRGVFVRAERIEVGDFAELGLGDDDEGEGSEMEEI